VPKHGGRARDNARPQRRTTTPRLQRQAACHRLMPRGLRRTAASIHPDGTTGHGARRGGTAGGTDTMSLPAPVRDGARKDEPVAAIGRLLLSLSTRAHGKQRRRRRANGSRFEIC